MSNDCELRWCKSNKPATVRVQENIGDGCFAVRICSDCQYALKIKEEADLPESHQVMLALRRFQRKAKQFST